MIEAFENILYLVTAGAILLIGVFVLRFFLKIAWKVVRTVLIIGSILLVAGYFLGYLDIVFR